MPNLIEICEWTIGDRVVTLVLQGEDRQSDQTVSASSLALLQRKGDTRIFAEATFDPILISRDLLVQPETDQLYRFKDGTDVGERVEAVFERLAVLELDWFRTTKGFFGANKFGTGGTLKGVLQLQARLKEGAVKVTRADMVAFATASVSIAGNSVENAKQRFRVSLSSAPILRIELDDLVLNLPDVEFPNLWLDDTSLNIAGDWIFTAPLIRGLADKCQIKSTITPAAKLKIDLTDGKVVWSVAPSDVGQEERPFSINLTFSEGDAGGQFALADVRAGSDGISVGSISGEITKSLRVGTVQAGPLSIEFAGDLQSKINHGGNAPELHLSVSKGSSVRIFARDDPSAVIAFQGAVVVSSTGVRLEELELVEPYPYKLAAMAGEGLARLADGLTRLTFSADINVQSPNLSRLLDVVARIAAAVMRAMGAAANAAGDMLLGLGRIVAEVIQAFGKLVSKLAESMGGVNIPVIVELRIGTDPLELRQIIVTPAIRSRTAPERPDALQTAGLKVEFHANCSPGLLIDLAPVPGVYLIGTQVNQLQSGATVASVATDLWLKRARNTEAVRDLDGDNGDRPEEPVLTIELKSKRDVPPSIVALAGVSGGSPVFLQKITGNIDAVVVGAGAWLSIGNGYGLGPLDEDLFEPNVTFANDRALALLGLGKPKDPSPGASGGFLDNLKKSLGQVVWIEDRGLTDPYFAKDTVHGKLKLGIQIGGTEGLKSTLPLDLSIDLRSLHITLSGANSIDIKSEGTEARALGLFWKFTPKDGVLYQLRFEDGAQQLSLAKGARIEVRYTDASPDSQGIAFDVESFVLSRSGLDLFAKAADAPIRLNGLNQPFCLKEGHIRIVSSRVTEAYVEASGVLPPELLGEAKASIGLKFGQSENGDIQLQSAKASLDRSGNPIVCNSTRFAFSLTKVGLDFVRDNGNHFFFVLTGSARFKPNAGEFESGLLQFLSDVEIELNEVPIASDVRVLARHMSFQVPLRPKKRFNLFSLFSFELRGIGFHPACPAFDGAPAMNLSGQIEFVGTGDVAQPKIDFHGLYIAPPEPGGSLPRIRADRLGVEIAMSGTAKIAGSVSAVDGNMPSLSSRDKAPDNFKAYGFLGDGQLAIEGFAPMSASFGFLELERKEAPGKREKAFFFYLQRNQVSYEIPTPIWPLYLREVGFGFGYRYTVEGIKAAESATSVAQLIARLDDVSRTQGNLADFATWSPDLEAPGDPARLTLALRGAFTLTSASEREKFNPDRERELPNLLFFDIVVALRSDMTFLMSARGWLCVNYYDWLTKRSNYADKPGFRGYLYISAPRHEFLGRFIGDRNGAIGEHPKLPDRVKEMLTKIDWESTLYIRPGLFQYEQGWPDRLAIRLADQDDFKCSVRGGMITRIADDALLQGFNLAADAYFKFGGSTGGDLGVSLNSSLDAHIAATFIAYIDTKRSSDTLFYGRFSLDACLEFSVQAWMKVDAWLCSFTIRIGFSISLQISAVVEFAIGGDGIGLRAQTRVAVRVFGCTLGVGIGLGINESRVDDARLRTERYMSLGLTAEATPVSRGVGISEGDKAIERTVEVGKIPDPIGKYTTPIPIEQIPPTSQTGSAKPKNLVSETEPAERFAPAHFQAVVRIARKLPAEFENADGVEYCYLLLVPRELSMAEYDEALAVDEGFRGEPFYAAPPIEGKTQQYDHAVTFNCAGQTIRQFHRVRRNNQLVSNLAEGTESDTEIRFDSRALWDVGPKDATLERMLAQCFIFDQGEGGQYRAFMDPNVHLRALDPPDGLDDELWTMERFVAQQRHAALLRRSTDNEERHRRAREARAIMLTQFLDQFATLSATGEVSGSEIHVVDLGLVFLVPTRALCDPSFSISVVRRREGLQQHAPRPASVFNPPPLWFESSKPVLRSGNGDTAVAPTGISLNWDLAWPCAGQAAANTANVRPGDPEFHLHYYEIVRSIEGIESLNGPGSVRDPLLVKPAGTVDSIKDENTGNVVHKAMRPDWQFSDNLTAVSGEVRRALLNRSSASVDEALAAIQAWDKAFASRSEISVYYSVTPVDIAGTRGIAHSFVVPISRPEPVIRPARAEVLIEVAGVPGRPDKGPPSNLAIYLGIEDLHWDPKQEGKDGWSRGYRLILDQEDILPAGSYGVDGLTDRLRGTVATVSSLAAQDASFDIPFSCFHSAGEEDSKYLVPRLVAESDSGNRSTRWTRLAIGDDERLVMPGDPHPFINVLSKEEGQRLIAALWERVNRAETESSIRVAVRFRIQTVIKNTIAGASDASCKSPISNVGIELRVRPERTSVPPLVMRPEAFEWPVVVPLPTLRTTEIKARSGLACLRMPKCEKSLKDLLGAESDATTVVRDPDHRTLTRVSWSAMPGNVATVDKRVIAGFGLFELDVDEVPESAVSFASTLVGRHSEVLATPEVWSRSRRIARTQLLSRDSAMLIPSDNAKLLGWRAHYPSESWRISSSSIPLVDHAPIHRPWFSRSESTLLWPMPVPKRHVLLAPEEALLSQVFSQFVTGGEQKVTYMLTNNAGKPIAPDVYPAFGLAPKENDNEVVSINELRRLLMSLTVICTCEDSKKVQWRGVVNAAAYTQIEVTPVSGKPVSFPIRTTDPLHPILRETLEFIAYPESYAGPLHRRYVVIEQPVVSGRESTLSDFMAATNSGKDPWGWGALQRLGLSVAFRLFDTDKDDFVEPRELLSMVERVFSRVFEDYVTAYGGNRGAFGTPMVEVMLRPEGDLVLQPFDGERESVDFNLSQCGLAFVQISLRPRPIQAWHYTKATTKIEVKEDSLPVGSLRLEFPALTEDAGNSELPVWKMRYGIDARSGQGASGRCEGGVPASIELIPDDGAEKGKYSIFLRTSAKLGENVFNSLAGRMAVKRTDQSTPLPVPKWEMNATVSVDDPLASWCFERFPAPDTKTWAARLLNPASVGAKSDEVTESFADLCWYIERAADAAPDGKPQFRWQSPDDLAKEVPAFLEWCDRFLRHGAEPDPLVSSVAFALATPEALEPWQIAPDALNQVTFSMLQKDRWAHLRSYAVQPIGRWHDLAAAAGGKRDIRLMADRQEGVGHKESATRRTEIVAAPFIFGSMRVDEPAIKMTPVRPGKEWEVVVAKHPEQELIESNRVMLARTEFCGRSLEFYRALRDKDWAEGFRNELGLKDEEAWKKFLFPGIPVVSDDDTTNLPALADEDIAKVYGRYPDIWRGATVNRISGLPYWYIASLYATVRAGIVVSPSARVSHSEFWYELPKFEPCPGLVLKRDRPEDNTRTRISVSWDLLRYRDLVDEAVRKQWVRGSDQTIADLPDPDVSYTLLTVATNKNGERIEESEFEVLVSRPKEGAIGQPAFEARQLGTRFGRTALSLERIRDGTNTPLSWKAELSWYMEFGADNPRHEAYVSLDSNTIEALNGSDSWRRWVAVRAPATLQVDLTDTDVDKKFSEEFERLKISLQNCVPASDASVLAIFSISTLAHLKAAFPSDDGKTCLVPLSWPLQAPFSPKEYSIISLRYLPANYVQIVLQDIPSDGEFSSFKAAVENVAPKFLNSVCGMIDQVIFSGGNFELRAARGIAEPRIIGCLHPPKQASAAADPAQGDRI